MNAEIQTEDIQLTYGELTMIKLEELLGDIYGDNRAALPVGSDFWDWRKENKARAEVLNKAGLVLNKTEDKYGRNVWTADTSKVTADTLDEARDNRIAWKRTEKELKDRANRYMRQCERAKYQHGGQFGG
jgi:hypothetical protein